jgi:hypothetical protein
MISAIEAKPGQGMTLRGGLQFDQSPVPLVDQERTRLLLEMKKAADFYELHFAIAEHAGFVRGLFMSHQISAPVLVVFQLEAKSVAAVSADRLAWVTQ